MIISCHLLIQANYRYNSKRVSSISVVRVTKNKPARKSNQIAVKLELDIPKNVFEDYIPELAVKVSLDEILKPNILASLGHITDDGLEDLAKIIRDEIGKRED